MPKIPARYRYMGVQRDHNGHEWFHEGTSDATREHAQKLADGIDSHFPFVRIGKFRITEVKE
jgi:hypothetical protein